MPKRVIDFDAMWGSDKLAACAAWAQAEYAWLYGLADASGCFELTNLRVIWGRVAAIRTNLTIERLEQVFAEFQDKGLLFVWEQDGKRYAHWTGSDVPGRLPPPSWRMRLEKFAPPVPKKQLAEYMAKYARGRAAFGSGGFCAETASAAPGGDATPHRTGDVGGGSGLKAGLEGTQGQDLGLDWNWNEKWECGAGAGGSDAGQQQVRQRIEAHSNHFSESNSKANSKANSASAFNSKSKSNSNSYSTFDKNPNDSAQADSSTNAHSGPAVTFDAAAGAESQGRLDFRKTGNAASSFPRSEKELAVARELRVGQGPVCGPGRVKPEVLERDRQRLAAQNRAKSP